MSTPNATEGTPMNRVGNTYTTSTDFEVVVLTDYDAFVMAAPILDSKAPGGNLRLADGRYAATSIETGMDNRSLHDLTGEKMVSDDDIRAHLRILHGMEPGDPNFGPKDSALAETLADLSGFLCFEHGAECLDGDNEEQEVLA